ncbi:MAG TPA: hypothetical protein VKB80_31875 [Kofleriaceae bacterium]|nr:hypothetical protein [Kofleriaceae bacterium]
MQRSRVALRASLAALALPAVLLGAAGAAHAKCEPEPRGGPLTAWPQTGLDPRGAILLSEDVLGRADADDLLDLLGPAPALSGGGVSVPLDVVFVARDTSECSRVLQILLRPTAPLPAGAQVELRAAKGGSLFSWRVAAQGERAAPPRWTGAPSVAGREYLCYVDSHLRVDVPVVGAERVRIRATPTAGGAVKDRVLPIDAGQIDIGHDSLTADVVLEPGAEYYIQIWAIDAGGREVAAPADLVARAPGQSDPLPDGVEQLSVCPPEDSGPGLAWLGPLVCVFLALLPLCIVSMRTRPRPVAPPRLPRCIALPRRGHERRGDQRRGDQRRGDRRPGDRRPGDAEP